MDGGGEHGVDREGGDVKERDGACHQALTCVKGPCRACVSITLHYNKSLYFLFCQYQNGTVDRGLNTQHGCVCL